VQGSQAPHGRALKPIFCVLYIRDIYSTYVI
jgi:hypothetical protein